MTTTYLFITSRGTALQDIDAPCLGNPNARLPLWLKRRSRILATKITIICRPKFLNKEIVWNKSIKKKISPEFDLKIVKLLEIRFYKVSKFCTLRKLWNIVLDTDNIYNMVDTKPTSRGGMYILYEGHRFVLHKKNESTGSASFRCSYYQQRKWVNQIFVEEFN